MNDDDLDHLLAPQSVTRDPLKELILARSLHELPRHPFAWRPLVSVAAALAIGLVTGWFLKPAEKEIETVLVERIVEVPAPMSEAAPLAAAPQDPDDLETQAELADPATAAKLYREAGDQYLKASELAAAARCYRLHLADAGTRTPMPGDSWLLLSLKSSNRMENPE